MSKLITVEQKVYIAEVTVWTHWRSWLCHYLATVWLISSHRYVWSVICLKKHPSAEKAVLSIHQFGEVTVLQKICCWDIWNMTQHLALIKQTRIIAGYDHLCAPMSRFTGSRTWFLRKSFASLPLLFLACVSPSLSLLYLPSEGLVFSVSLLRGIPRGWLTENTSYWTTQTGPQANSNSVQTHTQQQTHSQLQRVCTQFASVILWVTKWNNGDGHASEKVQWR